MAKTSENAVLCVAVCDDLDTAVIDKEDGNPHIVQRADHPAYRVIPEWLGSGMLSRRELHEVEEALDPGEAALVVVDEPTLEQGFEQLAAVKK